VFSVNTKDLFAAIIEKTMAGEDTVLATIVAEIGSSPRSAGAHMLVSREGRVCGTIGGGTVEYRAIQAAQGLLEKQKSLRKTYRLHKNDEEDLGMICGGDVEVYFQFIEGGDEKTAALMKEAIAGLEKDADLWLFIDLTNLSDWTMALYDGAAPPAGMDLTPEEIQQLSRNRGVLVKSGDRRLYGEPISFAGKVYIFGGGHCSQALAPVLDSVGFRCVIFDNREEYVSKELFPTAYGLIIGDYDNLAEKITLSPRDFIVIMTHAYDLSVLRQVVSKQWAYIGVSCSKAKAAALRQQLTVDGVAGEVLENINAPIGLKIRSETPEEIAVSIAGEMILRRAEKRCASER
jgi:xanthine dehydrogenase accessory factor